MDGGCFRCLICYSEVEEGQGRIGEKSLKVNVDPPIEESSSFLSERQDGVENQLSNNLHVIFTLRHMFEIPQEDLLDYLVQWGSPSNWIQYCGSCNDAVTKAWRIYREMVNAFRKLRKVKQDIIKIVKSSPTADQGEVQSEGRSGVIEKVKEGDSEKTGDTGRNRGILEITKNTRRFVGQHEYVTTDSFICGGIHNTPSIKPQDTSRNLEHNQNYGCNEKTENGTTKSVEVLNNFMEDKEILFLSSSSFDGLTDKSIFRIPVDQSRETTKDEEDEVMMGLTSSSSQLVLDGDSDKSMDLDILAETEVMFSSDAVDAVFKYGYKDVLLSSSPTIQSLVEGKIMGIPDDDEGEELTEVLEVISLSESEDDAPNNDVDVTLTSSNSSAPLSQEKNECNDGEQLFQKEDIKCSSEHTDFVAPNSDVDVTLTSSNSSAPLSQEKNECDDGEQLFQKEDTECSSEHTDLVAPNNDHIDDNVTLASPHQSVTLSQEPTPNECNDIQQISQLEVIGSSSEDIDSALPNNDYSDANVTLASPNHSVSLVQETKTCSTVEQLSQHDDLSSSSEPTDSVPKETEADMSQAASGDSNVVTLPLDTKQDEIVEENEASQDTPVITSPCPSSMLVENAECSGSGDGEPALIQEDLTVGLVDNNKFQESDDNNDEAPNLESPLMSKDQDSTVSLLRSDRDADTEVPIAVSEETEEHSPPSDLITNKPVKTIQLNFSIPKMPLIKKDTKVEPPTADVFSILSNTTMSKVISNPVSVPVAPKITKDDAAPKVTKEVTSPQVVQKDSAQLETNIPSNDMLLNPEKVTITTGSPQTEITSKTMNAASTSSPLPTKTIDTSSVEVLAVTPKLTTAPIAPPNVLADPLLLQRPSLLPRRSPVKRKHHADPVELDPFLQELLSLPPSTISNLNENTQNSMPFPSMQEIPPGNLIHGKQGVHPGANGKLRHFCKCGKSYVTNSKLTWHLNQPRVLMTPTLPKPPNGTDPVLNISKTVNELNQLKNQVGRTNGVKPAVPTANLKTTIAPNVVVTSQHSVPPATPGPANVQGGLKQQPTYFSSFMQSLNQYRLRNTQQRQRQSVPHLLPIATSMNSQPKPPPQTVPFKGVLPKITPTKIKGREKWFICGQCANVGETIRFPGLSQLTNHMNTFHNGWKCTIKNCGKRFPTHLALQNHIMQQQCQIKVGSTSQVQIMETAPIMLANVKKEPRPRSTPFSRPLPSPQSAKMRSALPLPQKKITTKLDKITVAKETDIICIDLD